MPELMFRTRSSATGVQVATDTLNNAYMEEDKSSERIA
jgi:hypothetical protein